MELIPYQAVCPASFLRDANVLYGLKPFLGIKNVFANAKLYGFSIYTIRFNKSLS